ncbi:MAG: VPLPA-CTERM sorting domain-containing protein [Pseudomonadota bacterium]
MKFCSVILGLSVMVSGHATAATIDFESEILGPLANGTVIDADAGPGIDRVELNTVEGVFGMSILHGIGGSNKLNVWGIPTGHGGVLRLDFLDGPISQISAFISDVDHTPVVIDAFDVSGGMIGTSNAITTEGVAMLSFASTKIAFVTIHDHGFDFFVDDITFSRDVAPVPIPASAWLLLTGLAMLAGVKRKTAFSK